MQDSATNGECTQARDEFAPLIECFPAHDRPPVAIDCQRQIAGYNRRNAQEVKGCSDSALVTKLLED